MSSKDVINAKNKRSQMKKIIMGGGIAIYMGEDMEGFENGGHCGHHGQFHPYGKRTPQSHPYNYDDFNLFVHPKKEELDQEYQASGAYTDRLLQWGWEKHNEACQLVWGNEGQYWDKRTPKEIEKFLEYYYGESDFIVTKIVQSVNHSNGYPLWYIGWVQTGKKKKEED